MQMNSATGVFSFKKNDPFYLNIEFRCDNGFLQFNYQFDIEVPCDTAVQTISFPTQTGASLSDPWVLNFTYRISLTDVYEPNYQFRDYGVTKKRCPIETREIWADAAYTTAVTNGLLPYVRRVDTAVQASPIY